MKPPVNKQNLISFCVLTIVVFYANILKAQPGWQDWTQRYYYTILDESEKEISFKNNKDYSIMIDNVLYKSPDIPQDSLKQAVCRGPDGSPIQIRINDFSLNIPQENNEKRLEIKIIHKKDTMYICQSSGTGSIESIEPKADYTLQLITGHYYFPSWAKYLLDNMPQTNGDVKIVNASQQHFIAPKNIYDSVVYNKYRYEQFTEVDEYVSNNFIKDYFSVEKRIEHTKFNESLPYENPCIYNGNLYPTKDPNRYYAMIRYYRDYPCRNEISLFLY